MRFFPYETKIKINFIFKIDFFRWKKKVEKKIGSLFRRRIVWGIHFWHLKNCTSIILTRFTKKMKNEAIQDLYSSISWCLPENWPLKWEILLKLSYSLSRQRRFFGVGIQAELDFWMSRPTIFGIFRSPESPSRRFCH